MQKNIISLARLVFSDRTTRNLFFFLVLNLMFAFVELSYGLWTNSLGLISDSFHMFFDCSALLLGLAASIISKWKPTDKFTYGFGRAEVLAGMANGLFLLFIALFITKEAIERTFEPPEVHHERLFVISVLGFLVNLVGIFVFQHGGQTHAGCSHSHSHSDKHHHSEHKIHDHKHHNHHHNHNHSHNHHHHNHSHQNDYTAQQQYIQTHQKENQSYNHAHTYSHFAEPTIHYQPQLNSGVSVDMNGYGQHVNNNSSYIQNQQYSDLYHHNNNSTMNTNYGDTDYLIPPSASLEEKPLQRGQIIQSVFLHIVADTLGSVGVIISAVLMNTFGWMIADPICSLFIAILISISVYPLLRDAIFILMQRTPVEIENKIPECLRRVQSIEGVVSVHESHFWTLKSDNYIGNIKLEVSVVDHKHILETCKNIFQNIGIDKMYIQIDQV